METSNQCEKQWLDCDEEANVLYVSFRRSKRRLTVVYKEILAISTESTRSTWDRFTPQ